MNLQILISSIILIIFITGSNLSQSPLYPIRDGDYSSTIGLGIQGGTNDVKYYQKILPSSLKVSDGDNSIKNSNDPHVSHSPVYLSHLNTIVNTGLITLNDGSTITTEEFDGFCIKALEQSFFLDPFCKSILQAILDKSDIIKPFCNFLFKGFAHSLRNFDPNKSDSWEFLLNLAVYQFLNGSGNKSCAYEIVEKLVIPRYKMLSNPLFKFEFDYELFNEASDQVSNDLNISAYLEEAVLIAFINRVRALSRDYRNDLEAQVHFKILLWEVSKDVSIITKKFDHYYHFLTNTPFKYIRKSRLVFDLPISHTQIESFLESLALNMYADVKESSHQELNDILSNTLTYVVNFSDIIEIHEKQDITDENRNNHNFDPFLWNPDNFINFLDTINNNIAITSALSQSEVSLLKLLQIPTHPYTLFVLQNFYQNGSINLLSVRSFLFSAFNQYFELSNDYIGNDLYDVSSSLFLDFDQTIDVEVVVNVCPFIVQGNHLFTIKTILTTQRYSSIKFEFARKALIEATYCDRIKVVKLLLELLPDIENGPIPSSISQVFILASRIGQEKVVKILLELRPKIVETGIGQALKFASHNGHEKTVKLLLESRPETDIGKACISGALLSASRKGHEQIVKLLLESRPGTDICIGSISHALKSASENGHEKIVKLLLESRPDIGKGWISQALELASQYGHVKTVKLLLESRPDIGKGCISQALKFASHNGHEKTVNLLLESRPDVDKAYISGALESASRNGHEKIVKLLLESRPYIGKGYIIHALKSASENGHEKVVRVLLESRRDIGKGYMIGALPSASRNGREKKVKQVNEKLGKKST